MGDEKPDSTASGDIVDLFIEKLSEKVTDSRRCRYCGRNEMMANVNVVASMIYKNKTIHANQFVPFGMLMCAHCGNTEMFNLLQMGILPSDKEEKA